MRVLSAFCSEVPACLGRWREAHVTSVHCCRPVSGRRARMSWVWYESPGRLAHVLTAMTNRERRWVSALVIEMAREDPEFVLEGIRKLKKSGEIGADDLAH